MANKSVPILVCILGALNLLSAIAYTADDAFVRIQSTQFTLDDHPFLFNGFNSYWLMHMAAGSEQDRGKVSDVFSEAAANNLTVCRTWAFADNGDRALQLSPGVYDEHVFQVIPC
jgi:mannan endo-1,4-beta-mannosidase